MIRRGSTISARKEADPADAFPTVSCLASSPVASSSTPSQLAMLPFKARVAQLSSRRLMSRSTRSAAWRAPSLPSFTETVRTGPPAGEARRSAHAVHDGAETGRRRMIIYGAVVMMVGVVSESMQDEQEWSGEKADWVRASALQSRLQRSRASGPAVSSSSAVSSLVSVTEWCVSGSHERGAPS